MQQRKKDIPILDRILSLRNKMGEKKLAAKLAELENSIPDKNNTANNIVAEICNVVGCPDIIKSPPKRWTHDDKTKQALSFSIIILRDHFEFSIQDLLGIFDFHRSYFYKFYDQVKELNPNSKVDKEVLLVYDTVVGSLKEKKLLSDSPNKTTDGR